MQIWTYEHCQHTPGTGARHSTHTAHKVVSGGGETFRITHQFHPLHGEEFEVEKRQVCMGRERIYFKNGQGQQNQVPVNWTDQAAEDPFLGISEGRSLFRVRELIELVEQVKEGNREGEKAEDV